MKIFDELKVRIDVIYKITLPYLPPFDTAKLLKNLQSFEASKKKFREVFFFFFFFFFFEKQKSKTNSFFYSKGKETIQWNKERIWRQQT